jgi:hypothetical protein
VEVTKNLRVGANTTKGDRAVSIARKIDSASSNFITVLHQKSITLPIVAIPQIYHLLAILAGGIFDSQRAVTDFEVNVAKAVVGVLMIRCVRVTSSSAVAIIVDSNVPLINVVSSTSSRTALFCID